MLEKYTFSDSVFHDDGDEWNAPTIYKAVEDQKLKPFKFPMKCMNLCQNRFRNTNNISDMAHHVSRCENVDMDIPIVLCPDGEILDGYHRIVRAVINGDENIMAYRLEKMPRPDRTGVK